MSLYAGDPVPVGTQSGPEIFGGLPAVKSGGSFFTWLGSHPIKLNEGNSFSAPFLNLAIWAALVGAVVWFLYARKK